MEEAALMDIESRMHAYPADARHDIARLIEAVRRARQAPALTPPEYDAPHLHDKTTGLLNAGAYGLRFAMARARATRYRKMFAVMSIEFERGRDDALRNVSERIKGCLRETDTVARIADERIAVILEDLTDPSQAERVKRNVEQALTAGIEGGALDAAPSAAIELQFYPEPHASACAPTLSS